MVEQVHAGKSMRSVARQFHVSVSTVALWIERCRGQRLGRAELGDRPSGRAWNRLSAPQERRILQTRRQLREHSALGEYGARAIAAPAPPKSHQEEIGKTKPQNLRPLPFTVRRTLSPRHAATKRVFGQRCHLAQ